MAKQILFSIILDGEDISLVVEKDFNNLINSSNEKKKFFCKSNSTGN